VRRFYGVFALLLAVLLAGYAVGDGQTVGYGKHVICVTNGSGDPYILTANDSGSVINNLGAGAQVYVTLPSASQGLTFRFISPDGDGFRITAASGDNIILGEAVSSTAGYIETTTQYSMVEMLAINDTTWGTPTYRNAWKVFDGTASNQATKIHAEYYVLNGNAAASPTITAGTPQRIGGTATQGHADGFTFTAANGGRMTYDGGATKDFLITVSISMTSSKNNTIIWGYVALNGTEVAKSEFRRKVATGTDIGAAAMTCELELATDDTIDVMVDQTVTNGTVTAETLNVSIMQVPE